LFYEAKKDGNNDRSLKSFSENDEEDRDREETLAHGSKATRDAVRRPRGAF